MPRNILSFYVIGDRKPPASLSFSDDKFTWEFEPGRGFTVTRDDRTAAAGGFVFDKVFIYLDTWCIFSDKGEDLSVFVESFRSFAKELYDNPKHIFDTTASESHEHSMIYLQESPRSVSAPAIAYLANAVKVLDPDGEHIPLLWRGTESEVLVSKKSPGVVAKLWKTLLGRKYREYYGLLKQEGIKAHFASSA